MPHATPEAIMDSQKSLIRLGPSHGYSLTFKKWPPGHFTTNANLKSEVQATPLV